MVTEVVTATPLPEEVSPTPEREPTAEPAVAPTPEPQVRQPGLYPDTVKVAVIFDDDTAGTADDLFADAWRGMLAWQMSLDGQSSLGSDSAFGGRQVEIHAVDAALTNHADVLSDVCKGDYFAIVGSQSLGDFDGAEILGTQECLMADFPGEAYGARRAASPVTFVPNPLLNLTRQVGPARYLVEQFPASSQDVALIVFSSLQLDFAAERVRAGLIEAGMNVTFEPQLDLQEDVGERVIPAWEQAEPGGLVWTGDPMRLVEFLAQVEYKPTFVLCEFGCYSEEFIETGREDVEGVFAWIPHEAFGSPHQPDEMISYQYWLNQIPGERGWSEIGLKSWLAGRLFEESMARLLVVEEHPSREQLVDAAGTIDNFTGNGILGFTSPGEGRPTPCFVLVAVRQGSWVKVHPQPPAELDCSLDNLYALDAATSSLGLVDASSTSSEAEPEPTLDADDLETPEEIPE